MKRFVHLRAGFILVPALLGALLLGACGGDSDGGGGGGTGSDEKFVADICKAGAQFQDDLTKLFASLANVQSEEEAVKKLAEPFESFAKSFKTAKPPSDLKQWHSEASKSLDEAVAAMKKGDANAAIFQQDSPFPEPPKGAEERLSKIAASNADCQKAELFTN
ncbi:hypothetical protein [Tepidiforma thermophila]|uniref:Lipoprotein n=1 Tax=Tepidiforma thermophila (strain KCTC 52669 / CGMCC 1.13589 / G233) TaxID=2761530 RepID=A0A2A9HHN7_TEPT2|nr:hypothetical protein [Tepidiforma thermophila]PFG74505.1 hypothetical protein A9A59_1738 [Tepidiforma thermophila]